MEVAGVPVVKVMVTVPPVTIEDGVTVMIGPVWAAIAGTAPVNSTTTKPASNAIPSLIRKKFAAKLYITTVELR